MATRVRDLVLDQIIVVRLSDGTEVHAMVQEKYPLDMDNPDGEYGIHLTTLGLMHFDADELVTVVDWPG